MTPATSLRLGIGTAVALVAGLAGSASAQVVDALVKGKALYAEASYDDALRALGTSQNAEAHQIRALCFLALGKPQDAERAIEALVTVSPEYVLSDADSPPRLVSLFAQTKRRLMPGIVRKLFAEARDDYQAKELDRARVKFERVLTLVRDPALADVSDLKDVQILTSGYLDIVKNAPPPTLPASAPVPATTVARATTPTSGPAASSAPVFPSSTAAATTPARSTSAAAPAATTASAPPPVTPPAAAKTRTPTVVPAVIVRQTVPPYAPQPGLPPRALSGTVKVVIGADGKVKSATMQQSVEPRYDIRLMAAAKSWLYKPATIDGQPTESEKLVSITVNQPAADR